MEIARLRIYHHPDQYVHQIYGEQEVGGTGWLYLLAVPFDEIGFRTDLGTTPYPEYTSEFLYGGAAGADFGLPALLARAAAARPTGRTKHLEATRSHDDDAASPPFRSGCRCLYVSSSRSSSRRRPS